jgi:hypothetical protein
VRKQHTKQVKPVKGYAPMGNTRELYAHELRGDTVPSCFPASTPLRILHGILWCYPNWYKGEI